MGIKFFVCTKYIEILIFLIVILEDDYGFWWDVAATIKPGGTGGGGGAFCFFIFAAIFITLNGKLLCSFTKEQPGTCTIGISKDYQIKYWV